MKALFNETFSKNSNTDNWQTLNFDSTKKDNDFERKMTDDGIAIYPKDENPQTGKPMFTHNIPQESPMGQLDHLKFSMLAKSSSENTSFTVPETGSINFETMINSHTYGLDAQPFGKNIKNPAIDFRLGNSTLMVMDPVNMIVFDFFVTNGAIYAVYERGKNMRGITDYAAYSYAIPLKSRNEKDFNKLRISYNKSTNTVKWFINDEEVYSVNHVGQLIDRKYMTIDNGGTPKETQSNSLNGGLGIFTLMDGSINGQGLIDLVGDGSYYDPLKGEPIPANFLDSHSLKKNRLFGQGVKLTAKNFSVYIDEE